MKHTSREVGSIKEKGQKNSLNSRKKKLNLKYIEISEISHLLRQKSDKKGTFRDKNWRESYYFNATDEKKKLSLITTIGILPNRGRCSGFVIILHNGRIAYVKLLFSTEIKLNETHRFNLNELNYQIEGIDWRLNYKSKKCSFNVVFRPINEFFSYIRDGKARENKNFNQLFSQHIEQAGMFEGKIILNGNKMRFGPSPGHRDHSWGIRNWSVIDNYWLFSCTFNKEIAFNLWKGSSGGKEFHEGYIFDSGTNLKIVTSKIKGQFAGDNREPTGCEIWFQDENQRAHKVECDVLCSVPIPMNKCLIYETIARMEYGEEVGFGLLEHHIHDFNPIHKISALVDIKKRGRRQKNEIHR